MGALTGGCSVDQVVHAPAWEYRFHTGLGYARQDAFPIKRVKHGIVLGDVKRVVRLTEWKWNTDDWESPDYK